LETIYWRYYFLFVASSIIFRGAAGEVVTLKSARVGHLKEFAPKARRQDEDQLERKAWAISPHKASLTPPRRKNDVFI
jgi:hypothetical protein